MPAEPTRDGDTRPVDVPPPTITRTFSWADGELVGCDYQWMTDDEAFIEEMRDGYGDEPRMMLVETWERTAVEVRTLWPSLTTCSYEDAEPCEEDAVVWQQEDDDKPVWMQACEHHRHALTGRTYASEADQ